MARGRPRGGEPALDGHTRRRRRLGVRTRRRARDPLRVSRRAQPRAPLRRGAGARHAGPQAPPVLAGGLPRSGGLHELRPRPAAPRAGARPARGARGPLPPRLAARAQGGNPARPEPGPGRVRRRRVTRPNAEEAALRALDEGVALREAGRTEEAVARLRAAVRADPSSARAWFQLGLALLCGGRHAEAEEPFAAALRLDPGHRLALLNQGNACHAQGRAEEACAWYRRALAQGKPFPMGWNNLGRALQDLGREDEAARAYAEGLALAPDDPTLLANLRSLCEQRGDLGPLAEACRRALSARPDSVAARVELSAVLAGQGRLDEAAQLAAEAAARDPDAPQAHYRLGLVQQARGLVEDAQTCFENALEADPDFAAARNALAGTLLTLGKLEEAIEEWGRCPPDDPVAASNRLLCLNYSDRVDRAALARAHFAWGERLEARVAPLPPAPREPVAGRPLRVGYLSADLREHPVASFFEPVLAAHDPDAVEVTCYSAHATEDATTRRLRALAARWRRVAGTSDRALAERIRADRIDVLVDLGGHTGGNRLPALALRAAPVQATWIGYPGTTGLRAVDARLTDRWADPVGETDELHTERLVRLGRCFLCFRPPTDAPAPRPLGPRDDGWFALGSFNNFAKLSPATIALWAQLLHALPSARLLVKNASLAQPLARARLEGLFAAHGVSSARLHLTGRVGFREHLALYDRVGLHLDPFPYAGTATTCEAAFMGVPTLTLAGDRHAARVGVSLAHALELPELVATSPADYLARAQELLGNAEGLFALKRSLRPRLLASPLCDAAGLARAVEAAYRELAREPASPCPAVALERNAPARET
ncbi:MAG: tetratricopeptide repeat protein [Planctomycetota bacterium]|nr:MAG: tetratricopeptide repeat protein [Planctomycetota bacterium]